MRIFPRHFSLFPATFFLLLVPFLLFKQLLRLSLLVRAFCSLWQECKILLVNYNWPLPIALILFVSFTSELIRSFMSKMVGSRQRSLLLKTSATAASTAELSSQAIPLASTFEDELRVLEKRFFILHSQGLVTMRSLALTESQRELSATGLRSSLASLLFLRSSMKSDQSKKTSLMMVLRPSQTPSSPPATSTLLLEVTPCSFTTTPSPP